MAELIAIEDDPEYFSKRMNDVFGTLTGLDGRQARIDLNQKIEDEKIENAERRLLKSLKHIEHGGKSVHPKNYGNPEENMVNVLKVREEARKRMKEVREQPSSEAELYVDSDEFKKLKGD